MTFASSSWEVKLQLLVLEKASWSRIYLLLGSSAPIFTVFSHSSHLIVKACRIFFFCYLSWRLWFIEWIIASFSYFKVQSYDTELTKKSGVESSAPSLPESPMLMLIECPSPSRMGADDSLGSPVYPRRRLESGHFSKQTNRQNGKKSILWVIFNPCPILTLPALTASSIFLDLKSFVSPAWYTFWIYTWGYLYNTFSTILSYLAILP